MLKLIAINHTFQKPEFYKRWKLLAQNHKDIDVTLLAPSSWEWGKEKTLTYGHVDHLKGSNVEDGNFHIHLIDTKMNRMGEWTSKLLTQEILRIKPDVVYFIGGHTAAPLMQIIDIRKKYRLDSMKIIAFSMRGHLPTLAYTGEKFTFKQALRHLAKQLVLRPRLKKSNQNCDAIFCHYPDAFNAFRADGYKGPIYMQTQVGVDPDIFYENVSAREKIRRKYNIDDAYLFGSASRFHYSKGLSEIIKALPQDGNWKFLMMGWGRPDEVEKIKKDIAKRGFEDRIILTGFIDNWKDMAEHWNALDCAVHVPLTTMKWEETFSLALVQAMATGLPVIGSSSGSVPYQIGPEGIIIQEGDLDALNKQFVKMINNPKEGKKIGAKMYERAISSFSIYHLSELFYYTLLDVVSGVHDEGKVDMSKTGAIYEN